MGHTRVLSVYTFGYLTSISSPYFNLCFITDKEFNGFSLCFAPRRLTFFKSQKSQQKAPHSGMTPCGCAVQFTADRRCWNSLSLKHPAPSPDQQQTELPSYSRLWHVIDGSTVFNYRFDLPLIHLISHCFRVVSP